MYLVEPCQRAVILCGLLLSGLLPFLVIFFRELSLEEKLNLTREIGRSLDNQSMHSTLWISVQGGKGEKRFKKRVILS